MKDPYQIKPTQTRLLVVEGNDDSHFLTALCHHLNLNITAEEILVIEGKDDLSRRLNPLILQNDFKRINRLGIILDADNNLESGQPTRFDQITQTLRQLNHQIVNSNPHISPLPVPDKATVFSSASANTLSVGIFIMPSDNQNGMLETLIWQALQDEPIAECVTNYFACLAEKGILPAPHYRDKAITRVIWASHLHVLITGKVSNQTAPSKERKKQLLSDLYRLSWWSWDKPIFDPIKQFLTDLING